MKCWWGEREKILCVNTQARIEWNVLISKRETNYLQNFNWKLNKIKYVGALEREIKILKRIFLLQNIMKKKEEEEVWIQSNLAHHLAFLQLKISQNPFILAHIKDGERKSKEIFLSFDRKCLLFLSTKQSNKLLNCLRLREKLISCEFRKLQRRGLFFEVLFLIQKSIEFYF